MTRFDLQTLVEFDLIHSLQNSKPLPNSLYANLLQVVCIQLRKNVASDTMFCVRRSGKANTDNVRSSLTDQLSLVLWKSKPRQE